MTLPRLLTLVRHGESEANVAQRYIKGGREDELPLEEYDARHDSFMRLTPEGAKQARVTGEFLRTQNLPDGHFYVSPHIRTQETAYNLSLDAEWRIDDRIRERDWGEVVSHRRMEDEERRIRSLNEWYWTPRGGESLASGLRLRLEAMVAAQYRRKNVEHSLMVCHGEVMRVFQFIIERLTPARLLEIEADDTHRVHNAMVMQYSSADPFLIERGLEAKTSNHYEWRRAICPWDRSLDWDDGEWVRIQPRRFSNEDLQEHFLAYPHLLKNHDLTGSIRTAIEG